MALSPSYVASQIIGSPSTIKFVDTSTGSDGSIASRRIYLTDYNNSPIVPTGTTATYIVWPLADSTFLADVLNNRSMALNILVEWVDVNGDIVVSVSTRLQGFTLFAESFYFSLTQAQAMQNQPPPTIIGDSEYYSNKGILRTELDSGSQAITIGGDIVSAQGCYDRADFMCNNQQKFF